MVTNRFTQSPNTSHIDEILALIDETLGCQHPFTDVKEDVYGQTYAVCEDCFEELNGREEVL